MMMEGIRLQRDLALDSRLVKFFFICELKFREEEKSWKSEKNSMGLEPAHSKAHDSEVFRENHSIHSESGSLGGFSI
jgi:hypothetical protein